MEMFSIKKPFRTSTVGRVLLVKKLYMWIIVHMSDYSRHRLITIGAFFATNDPVREAGGKERAPNR